MSTRLPPPPASPLRSDDPLASAPDDLPRDLGGGLVMRRATPDDAERIALFQGAIHRAPDAPNPNPEIYAWVMDLMCAEHPTFRPEDFLLVEDGTTGQVVSSLCHIPQMWAYDGITFGVGRPELVATHPDYRRRGLVRAQFETIHAWSAARGDMMQAITGIPWYYRQFGYEMALELGGRRTATAPRLPEGSPTPNVRVRPAREADIPFIARVYQAAVRRGRISVVRDEAVWRYELGGRSVSNVHCRAVGIIERDGAPVGYLAHARELQDGTLYLSACEVEPGAGWSNTAPEVLAYLRGVGETLPAADGKPFSELTAALGTDHPLYAAAAHLLDRAPLPYAWYIRVPNVPGFLAHVAPALERHLAASPFAGHSGELMLSFFRGGVRLAFEAGRLVAVEPWHGDTFSDSHAWFPDLCFLQLLTGYRSIGELRTTFADCGVRNASIAALLDALFPRQPSATWEIA